MTSISKLERISKAEDHTSISASYAKILIGAMADKNLHVLSKTRAKTMGDMFGKRVASQRRMIKEKAFYSGAGYSGVHDPDFDIPDDTSFFNREGFEKLKRYKKLAIDGNTVRAVEQADAGGDPITKLHDALTFNTQQALQDWLQKINAKPAGGKVYDIISVIAEDNTWPTK